MSSCWAGFLLNAGKPAGYDEKITKLNHEEQKWEIAVDGCFKEVSSSQWIYEYFVLSETHTLMKDNLYSSQRIKTYGRLQIWKKVRRNWEGERLTLQPMSMRENVIVWWRKTFSYYIWWRITETAKMTKTELEYTLGFMSYISYEVHLV